MKRLIKKLVYKGIIEVKTGLHIGGTNAALNIGGPDNFVVRNPIDNKPYIPGSSLKGKMRSLIELYNGETNNGNPNNNAQSKSGALFGVSGGEKEGHPSRLIVRDAELINGDEIMNTDLPYTESKTEVAINRITAKATPRTFERVPAGAKFKLNMVLNIFDDDNEESLKQTLEQAVKLLEDDYLGGGVVHEDMVMLNSKTGKHRKRNLLIMTQLSIIKMYNLSPLHIGTGRENYDSSASELHSDTLSSALAAVGVETGMSGNVEDFLTSFSMSSAFPFYRDIFFLPKPQGLLNVVVEDAEESEFRKKLKKVKYVEQNLWKQIVTGATPCISKSQIQGVFIVPKDECIEPLSNSQVMQRVSVSRDGTKDAEPFYFEWNYFNKDAGLYCLTDAKEHVLKLISQLFVQLGENGIGTDKNIGGGKFEVEIANELFSFGEPKDAKRRMSLSLFIPTEDELDGLLDGSPRYSLLLRGGYMAGSSVEEFRHLRKKMVYAFGEGSVFETTKPLVGKLVDLRPDWNDIRIHPVYRSGRALTLKIK